MVLIEFREATINKAFDEVEVAKDSMKQAKHALCNIEDLLYELYDSREDMADEEYPESEATFDTQVTGNDIEVNYRGRRGMRDSMRYRGGMRKGMRMRTHHSDRYTY